MRSKPGAAQNPKHLKRFDLMRFFEIKKIGGAKRWLVVEFWQGGEVRGPFFSEEEALRGEQLLAQKHGWSDLQKV